MNNRLKFRIWDKTQKDFYIDAYMLRTDGIIFVEHKELIFNVSQENFVIQQYTGLKDKNDKEIYEGDILSSHAHEKPCNYIVKWADDRSEYCGFVLNPVMKNPPRVTFHIHDFGMWMAEGFGVIGNIFENPELLAEKSLDETQIL